MSSLDDLKNDLMAEREALVVEEHKKMDAQGVSRSAYGAAAREEHIRLATAGIENNIASRYGEATGQMQGLGEQMGVGMFNHPSHGPGTFVQGRDAGRPPTLMAAVMHRAPQKMFTRAEVLAVLRAEKARIPSGIFTDEQQRIDARADTLDALTTIFERME